MVTSWMLGWSSMMPNVAISTLAPRRCSDLPRDNYSSFLTPDGRPALLAQPLGVRLNSAKCGLQRRRHDCRAGMRCFFPVRALDAIRIVSVCAATVPDVAAATFSDTIRFNSAPSLDVIPAAKRIGHRHHSVMLVSRTAAPRSAANWNGVCRCAIWVKLSSGMFVPYGGDAGAFSYLLSLTLTPALPEKSLCWSDLV